MENDIKVTIIGIPLDENSSYLRGAEQAPETIREALHCTSSNLCAENGVDLGNDRRWLDVGDLGIAEDPSIQPSMAQIENRIGELVGPATPVVALGGDHSITWPIMRATARAFPNLTILHLDAHPDLYDELDGNRSSHACPFARIMEEGLADRLVSVGIRTRNQHQREQAQKFGVETICAGEDPREILKTLTPPLYLSLDLDVLDPAFAPGVSHHEPGGLTTREVLDILHALPCPLIGADIVELNPDRDLNGMTAMVAAKLLKEIVAGILGEAGS